MAFTEFYCVTTGSNLNAGSTTSDSAVYTGVGDSDGTSVFTPSDGSTPASTVSVGDFGSVYVTSGATVATFIGRITAVAAGVNGAVTFSTTAKSGTFPASSGGAHTITLKTGGAWKGPNGTSGFPLSFTISGAAMTNAAGDIVRVNLKNGTTYSVTAAMTNNSTGSIVYQGYTSTPGDLGKAIIDGGTSGASYVLYTINNANAHADLIFQNNGATGTSALVSVGGDGDTFMRCVAHDSVGTGFSVGALNATMIECEAYNCNLQSNASTAGFAFSGSRAMTGIRCISHDNTSGTTNGFILSSAAATTLRGCIADTNSGKGFNATSTGIYTFESCDAYNNSGDGIDFSSASATKFFTISNCNLIKNGGWGINSSGTALLHPGQILNCGFGAGTQVNTSGGIATFTGVITTGTVTYASNVTPWVDPANGDFRINLATAKGTGRGAFTQTAASYAGTIGYPDIGASQHLQSGSSYTFA